MSREIKFRAWDGSKGRFIIETDMVHVALTGDISHCSDSGISGRNELALIQYTGLKDKNGVEIYEGDILKTSKGNGKITWEEGRFWFECVDTWPYTLTEKQVDATGSMDIGCDSSEVIGNIHENPELLK